MVAPATDGGNDVKPTSSSWSELPFWPLVECNIARPLNAAVKLMGSFQKNVLQPGRVTGLMKGFVELPTY